MPLVSTSDLAVHYGADIIFSGVDLDINERARIGIVGPSGSGKSSIVRLALRLYDPDSGKISLGGTDLRDLSFAQIRGHFAVVHQDTYLFHGTAKENIRFGRPDATHAELEAAARAANSHEFISHLPQGYDTVIGERGVRLSGGNVSASPSPVRCSATLRFWF